VAANLEDFPEGNTPPGKALRRPNTS